MPKTNAEYCREYRKRKQQNKHKKEAKSATERVREFRARQRKELPNEEKYITIVNNDDLTVQNTENDHSKNEKLKSSKMADVIDLDCDDTITIDTKNSEIHSRCIVKESDVIKESSVIKETNVNSTLASHSNVEQQKLKKEPTCTVSTDVKQSTLTPATNSSLDLDKFKRRLIRVIARPLVIEKKPENQLWEELKKVTLCDCKLLWTRMRAVTIKKLKRLLAVEDKVQHITKIARLSVTDWLLIDLVLVHEKVDVIGQDEQEKVKDKKEPKALEHLFKLVLKYNIEKLSGNELTEAWYNAANEYNQRGRFCSPMLLQRRWFQLKELVWYNFYNFWYSYRGDVRNLISAAHFKPTTFQTEIIKHFSKIVTEQFQTWEELIEQKKVVLLEDFERYELSQKKGGSEENEPDLVVIEPLVETIDLRLESDSDSDNTSDTNDAEKTENYSKVNLFTVKNESVAELSDVDDINMLETVNLPLEILKSSNITLNDSKCKNDKKNANVNHDNRKAHAIGEDGEVISDSDEAIIDRKDNILHQNKRKYKVEVENIKTPVNLNKSTAVEIDLNKSYEQGINYENTERSSGDVKMPLPKITSICGSALETTQEIKSKQGCDVDVMQDNGLISKKVNNEGGIGIPKAQEVLTNLVTNIKDEISTQSVNNIPDKQNMNILYDVTSNIGVYMNGLELEDDGIEYFEEDEDDEVTETVHKSENSEEENDSPKIDVKLLLQTVVYTKRLNDMDVFRFIDYKSVNDAHIIKEAMLESIPVYEKSFKMENTTKCQNAQKNNTLLQHTEDSFPNDSNVCQERVNYNSWYFKKPKINSYNPIQLCKNPDFNTRLKRLTAGFFSSERNRRLLKQCKPMTIDLYKSFENKLFNNSLLLDEFPSQTIKKEIIQPTPPLIPEPLIPTNSAENVVDTSTQCLPKVCYLPNQVNEIKAQIVERHKIINLPDIDQIRRTNEKLLIAEVTPMQVCSTISKPPVEILQPTANIRSIKEQNCQSKNIPTIQNMENRVSPKRDINMFLGSQPVVTQESTDIINLVSEEREELENKTSTSKKRGPSSLNIRRKKLLKGLERLEKIEKSSPSKTIQEFVRKGIPTDRLLALDTVERILSICQNNIDPSKYISGKKNKVKQLQKQFLKKIECRTQSTNKILTGNAKDISIENNERTAVKETPVIQITNKILDECDTQSGEGVTANVTTENSSIEQNIIPIINNKKKKRKPKRQKPPRTIYCCWAREKLLSMSKPRPRLSPHTCSMPLCSCCCRNEYAKELRKIHDKRQNTSELLDSVGKQTCEPQNVIKHVDISHGTNTENNSTYALNLHDGSKMSCNEDASEKVIGRIFLQQQNYPSFNTSSLDKISQVQTNNVTLDSFGELNPIITSVQSLSEAQPVVQHDVEQINENKGNSSSSAKCKTNVLYSLGTYNPTQSKEQSTCIPELLTPLTLTVPNDKGGFIQRKVHTKTVPISLGKNKILLCSNKLKYEAEEQNEPSPSQESLHLMLASNNQLTLAVDPGLNLDLNQLKNPPTISFKQTSNCDLNEKASNENPNDTIKASEKIGDVSCDKSTEDLASSSNHVLTQDKSPADIDKCREKLTDIPKVSQNVTVDSIRSPPELHMIENYKSLSQNETVLKSADDSTKKTILSDLMEMSGISLEDIAVNNENIPSVDEKKVSANFNISTNNQLATVNLDLNVVSSLNELKYAHNSNMQFYKMDTKSGQIIPINVKIVKKHTKLKAKPILNNTVIDLTDEGENETVTSNSPPIEQKLPEVRPLKLYKSVHPLILRKRKSIMKSILKYPVTSTTDTIENKILRKRKQNMAGENIENNTNTMKCDENVISEKNDTNSDSDDEPLALKVKRKKEDYTNTKNTEEQSMRDIQEAVKASGSNTNINNSDIDHINVNPLLEPVVFNDSSDEDCILGV